MGIQWDEITHLNGGSLLLRGEYQEYFASYAFYPPIFDLITASLFGIIGISVFTARLVSVIFAVLSLIIVFKISNKMYGQKTALFSAILFGVMPGFVWLSRVAMIETMLVFFFTTSMYFFYNWMSVHKNKDLILSGIMLGVGFLVKYQMIIAGLIMLTSILILGRNYYKNKTFQNTATINCRNTSCYSMGLCFLPNLYFRDARSVDICDRYRKS